jgi:hypothetical protein
LPPAEIEELIFDEFASGRVGGLWDISISCTPTDCSILYQGRLVGEFDAFLRSAPINADGVMVAVSKIPNDGIIRISTYREPLSDDYVGAGATAEQLEELKDSLLPSDDPYAEPFVHDSPDRGYLEVIENICSIDCPLDVQKVLHYQTRDGRPCEDLARGEPKPFLVRNEDGSFEDRVLCIEVPYY